MADGTKRPIEEVRAGDRVKASDPRDGQVVDREVVRTFRNVTETVVDVTWAPLDRVLSHSSAERSLLDFCSANLTKIEARECGTTRVDEVSPLAHMGAWMSCRRVGSGRGAVIEAEQPAQTVVPDDPARAVPGARVGVHEGASQPLVRSFGVVVLDVRTDDTTQVILADEHEVAVRVGYPTQGCAPEEMAGRMVRGGAGGTLGLIAAVEDAC